MDSGSVSASRTEPERRDTYLARKLSQEHTESLALGPGDDVDVGYWSLRQRPQWLRISQAVTRMGQVNSSARLPLLESATADAGSSNIEPGGGHEG